MNRCTIGQAANSRYGKRPSTCARCSSQRKKAAIARKTHTPIVTGVVRSGASGLVSDVVDIRSLSVELGEAAIHFLSSVNRRLYSSLVMSPCAYRRLRTDSGDSGGAWKAVP